MFDPLWLRTLHILSALRPAFSRQRTFLWFSCVACAFLIRPRIDAVTGMAAALGGGKRLYMRLLDFFASSAVCQIRLGALWGALLLRHPRAIRIGKRVLLALDGTKAPRSGRRMPGVKRLHQSASTNTKPEYITGHSMQSIAVLWRSLAGVAALPLFTRILEGLKACPRDSRSQIDRLPEFLAKLLGHTPFYLVADAYYAVGKFAIALRRMDGHLITRARGNAVAYQEPKEDGTRKRGRPRKYGKKVRLHTLAKNKEGYVKADSPLYGETGVTLLYKEVRLLWRPLEGLVKFVIVRHPHRGKGAVFLMTTDLDLSPLDVIMAYGLRFKIEVSFKSAVHSIGSFAYHFWTHALPKAKRIGGDRYTHRMARELSKRVWEKFESYHVFLQVAAIAQGITQILAAEMPAKVRELDTEYRRTVIALPSEATVKRVLEKTCRIFSGMTDDPGQCINRIAEALGAAEATPAEQAVENQAMCA
jgi:hypothetical protein